MNRMKSAKKMNPLWAGVVAMACVGLAAPGAQAAPAHDQANATPKIVGGEEANSPNIVQLSFSQGDGGSYGCSGQAINAEWIVTAKHCTEGSSDMSVNFSNSTSDQSDVVQADKLEDSPNGDVGLVHLSQPHELDSYADLTDSYSPSEGTQGDIYGYGLRANKEPTDHLYTATVDILGESTDAFGGNAIHVQGVNGASNHGDSGGPMIVDGKTVGVCSTGDSDDPGADTHAGSNYANLSGSRDWIQQTAGV